MNSGGLLRRFWMGSPLDITAPRQLDWFLWAPNTARWILLGRSGLWLRQASVASERSTPQPGAAADAVDRRRFSKPSCPARLILFRWGAGKASQRFPIEPMTTQGLPTVVPFDKCRGFGNVFALPGSPSGAPTRHRLPFSTWASVSCAVGFSLAGRACGFAEPRWHRTGPRPNHALQPTPWIALAFPSLRGRRG